jgi:ADP-ribosylglycohydrolase
MSGDDFADRARGILLGLAAGDRIGGPIRMAMQVASSLADRGQFDRADIGARYLIWWRTGGFDTGLTSRRVFDLVIAGQSFDQASAQVHIEARGLTAGCSPAHRAAPLAMTSSLADEELPAAAVAEATLTHAHPLAGDASAATVVLCRALIRGVAWEGALALAQRGRLEETARALTPDGFRWRAGGYAPDTLAAAVHFLSDHNDFGSALKAVLRFAGPPNFPPVLVGSIGGARWGAEAIEPRLLAHCDILPEVRKVADWLGRAWRE